MGRLNRIISIPYFFAGIVCLLAGLFSLSRVSSDYWPGNIILSAVFASGFLAYGILKCWRASRHGATRPGFEVVMKNQLPQSIPNASAISQQLMWVVQALAQPAEVQLQLFPDFVCKADELALDLGHWRLCFLDNYRNELTPDQVQTLVDLDRFLAEMSGQHNGENWTDDALRHDPKWTELRSLAQRALSAFGWNCEAPPTGRAIYVPGTKRVGSANEPAR